MIPFPRVKERENRQSFKANASSLTLKGYRSRVSLGRLHLLAPPAPLSERE